MIGTILGSRFQIEQSAGNEGPVDLYFGTDTGSGASVLLWVIDPARGASPELAGDLREGARRAQAVVDGRAPRVLDIGEDSGVTFVAVERAEGASLDQLVKGRGRLSVGDATGLAYQTLRVLETIHSAKLVHGGVEPRKLVLREDGLLKLTGLEAAWLSRHVPVSKEYASPEVAAGAAPDARSDVYSVAAVLYELLSGRLPFPDEAADRTVAPIPVRHLRPDAPRELDTLLASSLEANPDRRPQSALEMENALEAAMHGKPFEMAGPIPVAPPEPPPPPVPTPEEVAAEAARRKAEAEKQKAEAERAAARRGPRGMMLVAGLIALIVVAGGAVVLQSLTSSTPLLAALGPAPTPTIVPTEVPPTATAVPPTRKPTTPPATAVPTRGVVSQLSEQDSFGRQWRVYSWSDGTTTREEIVPPPALAQAGATVRGLRLFESGAEGLAIEKRVYATRFSKETARFLNYELDLTYPDPKKTVNFTLRAYYYDAAGQLVVFQSQNAHIEGGWTQSYHWNGYGWPDPGHWQAGKYRLDLFDGSDKIVTVPFEVY